MKLRGKCFLPVVVSSALFSLFLFEYWEPLLIDQKRSDIVSGELHGLASLEASIKKLI